VSLQASLALPSRASSGVLQFGVYGWTMALEPVEAVIVCIGRSASD
jgi:hypothetical protein